MDKACLILHNKFSVLPRFSGTYQKDQVPQNGLYIVFEKGETAHKTDRIVSIGTHTGENNLPQRINEHLFTPKKDRSIFRKHIGRCILAKQNDTFLQKLSRCILAKQNDTFLQQWEIDLTTKAHRDKYANNIDFNKLEETERKVSKYITNNLSFAVIEVNDKQERLNMKSSILSTIACCNDCSASNIWLGNHHPNQKIRHAGLWNVEGLNKSPLSEEEAEKLWHL